MKKIILDLCGGTGAWSAPYREAGYDVRNITLPEYDVRLYEPPKNVYGILAAPPCTMFSFARTNAKRPRDLHGAMETVNHCLRIIQVCQERIKSDNQKYSNLKFWALENPNKGMLKWFLGKPIYVFSPDEFGHDYQKETALWGYFNEPIKLNEKKKGLKKFDYMASKDIHPEYFGKFSRTVRRSITPRGFAEAFFKANQ